jgi:glycosyltransferase involved in cell wall biosynthesis
MRVALLTNFIAPYRVPLLEALHECIGDLRVLVCTRMERDRSWVVDWRSLDVVVQRTLTFRPQTRDMFGLPRWGEIHVPCDSLEQLRRWAPDVVISGELGARSLQAAAYCALRPEVPLLIWAPLSEHIEKAWDGLRRWVRQRIPRRADGVLVNGESGARYIRRFGLPDQRIFRINQPVDVDLFTPVPRQRPEASCVRLLYSGMLAEHKGLRHFATQITVWARAHPSRSVEIWWLGDGALRPWLESQVLPGNLSQHFCGAVQYGEVAGFYAQCDTLVLPSLRDEWGLVVNEALASGLPVLGSVYSQAVEELVEEGRTGWIFDPLSEASALTALDRMFATTQAEMACMRDAARQSVSALTPASTARQHRPLHRLCHRRGGWRPPHHPRRPAILNAALVSRALAGWRAIGGCAVSRGLHAVTARRAARRDFGGWPVL